MSSKGIIAIIAVVAVAVGAVAGVAFVSNQEYTVTYDLNYDGAENTSVTVKTDTMLDEPVSPFYLDHTFTGWYSEKECVNKITFPYKVTGNVTFYASWKTSMAAKYFNENFYKDTEYGRYLAQANKETTGFKTIHIENGDLRNQIVSYGMKHIVVPKDTGKKATYNVVGIDDKKVLFSFPAEGVLSIKSVSITQAGNELVLLRTANGYFLYDMSGNCFGPAASEPAFLFNSIVLFGGIFYEFNEKGDLQERFAINPDHMPIAGNGDTFCELYGLSYDADLNKHYKYLNVLDREFNVKKSIGIPESAVNAVCFYITDGKFLFQYWLPTSSDNYDFTDDGQRYKLVSLIVDRDSSVVKGVVLPYPAFAASNVSNKWNFTASLTKDIKNVISFYKVGDDKVLDKSGKLLIAINSDGSFYKSFSISESNYRFTFIFPLETPGEYITYIDTTQAGDESPSIMAVIINGSGGSFDTVLTDVTITQCVKYYMVNGSTDIYDPAGNKVGSFEGKTFVDSTNNVLFFTDGTDLYAFCDGAMKKIANYGGDLICKTSFYGFKNSQDNKYCYFTENGTEMADSATAECREITSKNGMHIAEIYLGNGEFAIFELTTE